MSNTTTTHSGGHIGSLIVSALFVIAGFVALYDTNSYTDSDSQVFPRTVAIVMIITAAIAFITQFLKPTAEEGFGRGVWWRRILFVVAMFLTCAFMPHIGFLPASLIGFFGGLFSAQHGRWSIKLFIVYCGAGLLIMAAFFVLFKYVLLVPLP